MEFFATPDEADKCESFTGVLAEPNEDIRGLKQLAIYGCKGMSAYARHAANLGYEEEDVYAIIENAIAETARPDMSVEDLLSLVLEVGDGGVKVMDLLDRANTSTYGNPEVTKVDIGVRNRPGILISGHDLKDLEELLEQTKDKGVDVYTGSAAGTIIRFSRNILTLPETMATHGGSRPLSLRNSTASSSSLPIASCLLAATAPTWTASIRQV